jgi:hypothetical protein
MFHQPAYSFIAIHRHSITEFECGGQSNETASGCPATTIARLTPSELCGQGRTKCRLRRFRSGTLCRHAMNEFFRATLTRDRRLPRGKAGC